MTKTIFYISFPCWHIVFVLPVCFPKTKNNKNKNCFLSVKEPPSLLLFLSLFLVFVCFIIRPLINLFLVLKVSSLHNNGVCPSACCIDYNLQSKLRGALTPRHATPPGNNRHGLDRVLQDTGKKQKLVSVPITCTTRSLVIAIFFLSFFLISFHFSTIWGW